MTRHLIGPSNLITPYFGIKTVWFESQEYRPIFSDKIIYFTQIFPDCLQIEQSVGLAVLVCSLENVTFRLEVDEGRNHF